MRSWVIRNSTSATGKMLAVNGLFGGLGAAAAGAVAGLLVDYFGWRAAFWVPGALCVASGLHLWWHIAAGQVVDRPAPPEAASSGPSRASPVRQRCGT